MNHLSGGKVLMQLCPGLILLTVLLTSLNCRRRQSNNDVKICVILDFARWWQSFTIKCCVVSALKLTVIISALATEHY